MRTEVAAVRPEEALGAARKAAAARRADGAYADDPALQPAALDAAISPTGVTPELLREWAVIAVEPGALYSSRRLGAPVTLLKRLLVRLLGQYLAQLEARQTRFNVALLARIEGFEARLGQLGARLEQLERDRA